jgi:hypothetical protein
MPEAIVDSRATLTTVTATREPADPDDEDAQEQCSLQAGTTIVTKADSDNNQQDYDDEDVAFAGTTTLTESSGDHESDPDSDDLYEQVAHLARGDARPLFYRFAEEGISASLRFHYDDSRQVNVLRDGRTVVSALLERGARS